MTKVKIDLKDPLDAKAKGLNFINNNKYSNEYKELAKKWSALPIYNNTKYVKQIFNLIDKKQVILLTSGTGSGKTVIMPKFLIKYFMSKGLTGKVATTNPKIITTQNNAVYAAKTLDVELGDFVGCKYKDSNPDMISDNSKLLYVTDGLILAIINGGDILLKDYNGIIIDEAHERQINIDLLLKYLKDIVLVRDDFKIIIMSATINSNIFKKYFKHKKIKFGTVDVSSTPNFPIQQHFLNITFDQQYLSKAVNICLDIIEKSTDGDIIIFVPTTKDALTGCDLLKEKCPTTLKTKQSICNKLYCVSVYSKMTQENKDLAISKDLYKNKDKYIRKIIFATNVAESSITFDGLVYVIDTGLEFANYYDVKQNSDILLTRYTTQAQIKQRIGRVGRTQSGIAYHMYKKNEYSKFNKYPEPSIMTVNLTDTLLSIINLKLNITNTIQFISDLLTPIRMDQFCYSLSKLHFINAIKLIDTKNNIINYDDVKYKKYEKKKLKQFKYNGAITTLGRMILKLKINYLNAFAIIISKFYNCFDEMLIIISIIESVDGQLSSLLEFNNKERTELKSYFSKDVVNDSDHLTIYNIFTRYYMNVSKNDNYKYINVKMCSKIVNTYNKLKLSTENISDDFYTNINDKYLKLNTSSIEDNSIENRILLSLSIAYKYNTLILKDNKFNTINWLNNQSAIGEYFFLTPNNNSEKVICNNLINISNNKKFTILSKSIEF